MIAVPPNLRQAAADRAIPATRRKPTAVLLAALGLVIVFAAGFSPSETVHNAAHDSRHSFAFPCH